MPNLKRMSADSDAIGTTCTAHGIWSLPSVASMMTGKWPSRHGVGLHNEALPSDVRTVAGRLSEISYRTVGLSTNPFFSPETNLDRGFDQFDSFDLHELVQEAGVSGLASFARNVRRYSAGLTLDKSKHSHDFLLNEVVKSRLTELAGGGPFAVFAHYMGVHHPYFPSPTFRNEFRSEHFSPREAAELAYRLTVDPYATIAHGRAVSEEEWEGVRAAYDSLTRQVDDMVWQLIEHLRDLGVYDDTILVVTSDHGDLLGEHGLVSHKLLLHDALIQVPVVVRGSERLSGVSDSGTSGMQHIDVIQTILDEVGASTEGMDGEVPPGSGRGYSVTQRGAETAVRTVDRVRQHVPDFDHPHVQEGLISAIRTDEWKLIKGSDRSVLYRLPDEDSDLSSAHPDRSRELSLQLDEWIAEYGEPLHSDRESEFSESVKRRLGDLGYVVD